MNGIYCFWSQKICFFHLYTHGSCVEEGKEREGKKKIFVSCVKQTDEQRDPQRGCVMFGQPLLCVCSVFAWNSHDHQTPGYIHGGLHSILHTFWHQSSELYIFLILVNLYKYPRAFVTENVTVQYFSLLSVLFCWLSTGNYACHLKTRAENRPE